MLPDDSNSGSHAMLAKLLPKSNWAQLAGHQQFSGSTLGHQCGLNLVIVANASNLWITFGLASSFTLHFVVDCLVNPRVYSDICFHQQYLRTIILQSLDFNLCICCDSKASHFYHSAKANHKKMCLYSDTFPLITLFFPLYRVGMNRISGLQGLLPCQSPLWPKIV